MKWKKILTLLTAGVLLSASLPVGVLAAGTDEKAATVQTDVTGVSKTEDGKTEEPTKAQTREIPEDTNDVQYAIVTIEDKDLTYTGNAVKPAVTVTLLDEELESGTDYKVTYPKNAVNAGKYSITVKGIGDYTGKIRKKFTIKKAVQTLDLKKSYKLERHTQGFSLAPNNLAKDTTVTYKSADSTIVKMKKSGEVIPKNYGKTTVTVTAKNDNYKTVKKKVKITLIPDQLQWNYVTSKRVWNSEKKAYDRRVDVEWKPDDDATNYEVQISYRKDLEDPIFVETPPATKTENGITKNMNQYYWVNQDKLKTGRTYYIRVRSLVTVNDVTYKGKWSQVKSFVMR